MTDELTQKFISRVTKIHGDKFDYSNTVYTNKRTKVEIICRKHGSFYQLPQSHYIGYGCRKCAVESRFNTQDNFVQQITEKHNGKYDYSKVVYTGTHSKIEIICPTHGSFHQEAGSHLLGIGCPKCAIENVTFTKEEFITRSIDIHGDCYDYSDTQYTTVKNPVTIVCKEHGSFSRLPYLHLSGYGCPVCRKRTHAEEVKNKFIIKANVLYNDKYDYSQMTFIQMDRPVSVICPIHGRFTITPNLHLNGHACKECAVLSRVTDTASFIIAAKSVHGDKYNYAKVDYITSKLPVIIGCPEHGEFLHTPRLHLNTTGCPECGQRSKWLSKVEGRPSYFYIVRLTLLEDRSVQFYKVGITTRHLHIRFKDYKVHYDVELIYQYIYINPRDAYDMEDVAKHTLIQWSYIPPYKFGGSTSECFSTDADLTLLELLTYTTDYIKSLLEVFAPGAEYVPFPLIGPLDKVRLVIKDGDYERIVHTMLDSFMLD